MKRSLCIVFWLANFTFANAQYPTNFAHVSVAASLLKPTAFAFAPDGRIFVTQQAGLLRVIKAGVLLPTPFVSLTVNSSDERGLLGVAFDPDFETNHYIYLYYTVPTPLHNRVSRFTADGDVAVAASESIVIDLAPLSATNHNGGAIAFGPDGKLYVAIGENAVPANAQNLDTYHGKILRINKDGTAPSDNPFPTGSEQKTRVWAYGVRNPYTIAFQPGTGTFFVNDVGQSTWEEINNATSPGGNYGWPGAEGMSGNTSYVNPVYAYGRGSSDGLGCAITGGTFFNPQNTNYPSTYYGKYFFLDYCSKWINYIDPSTGARSSFATNIPGSPVDLKTGPDGNLYFLGRANEALYRIQYSGTSAPFITEQPTDTTVQTGAAIELRVRAIGSMPISYQWTLDGTTIPGATAADFSIVDVDTTNSGIYKVTVSNAHGSVTSDEVQVTVTPDTVVGVASHAEGVLRVYPNPVHANLVTVLINATNAQSATIFIYNILGKKSLTQEAQIKVGVNEISITTGELPEGIYILRSVIDGERLVGKFVVAR